MSSNKRHILLSSMGANGSRPTEYTLGDCVVSSGFSAFGLWKLLPEENRPSEAWFLMTPEARKNAWDDVQKEATQCGIDVKCIDLPGGTDANDTTQFLEVSAKEIPKGCNITLDITQGLRHHAFLFYALSLYLSQFRDITIEGAWYCRLETSDRDAPKPLIDLKPIIELAHWFHALAVFEETGATGAIARRIDPFVDSAKSLAKKRENDSRLHKAASEIGKISSRLKQISISYEAGLPLELGKESILLNDTIAELPAESCLYSIPMVKEIFAKIADETKAFSFELLPKKCGNWKESIPLTRSELDRQASLIDEYIKRDQIPLAAGLMNEWVVSFVVLQLEANENWLEYKPTRQNAANKLGALSCFAKSHAKDLTDDQKQWATFGNQLTKLRNSLHHHGMRSQALSSITKEMGKITDFWKKIRSGDTVFPAFGGCKGKLLICPIGNTPGVLYSALSQVKPDRCLIICSESSRQSIDEAIKHAEWKGEVEYLEMDNPFTGIDEFSPLQNKAGQWLFQADEVHASLTGGTTLMGVLTGRLVGYSKRKYQREVREFVLIDKRTPEKQRNDPWQLGDIHYLDEGASKSDSDDKPENKTNEGETS